MERLQKWADEGSEPSTLKKSEKAKHSVTWLTEKGLPKLYTQGACERTLEKLNKGRR